MHFTHRIVPGLVAGSLLLGSASAFAAKTPAKARAHVVVAAGQVSGLGAANAAGFTLTWTPKKVGAAAKTWQISTAAATKEIAAKGTTGSLQNGEYAIVIGTKTASGITARSVRFSVHAFKGRLVAIVRARVRLAALTAARVRVARGTVNATQTAGTLSITVTGKKATRSVTFTVTPTTKYFTGKTLSASPLNLTAGEKVAVRFHRNRTTKALDALAIRVLTAA